VSWSYAPLVALGITAGAFAIKMPIEVGVSSEFLCCCIHGLTAFYFQEDLIIQDPATAAEYRAYMQRVPARVIPFLW
jgi:hypothetical protein